MKSFFRGWCVLALVCVAFGGSLALAANQTDDFSPIVVGDEALPFGLEIEQVAFGDPLPVLQSYVVGMSGGRWLLFGGRTNGLHNFTSDGFLNFPPDKQNLEVWVVDPVAGRSWFKRLDDADSGLSLFAIDSLSTTNTQFFQEDGTLYVTGGYGFDRGSQRFVTYDTLSVIDVAGLMAWVMGTAPDGALAADYIRQTRHGVFQVTGGDMFKVGDKIMIVFGQDFEGPYLPSISGAYTKQVRSFVLFDNGDVLVPLLVTQSIPAEPYRRRDLNVVPVVREMCIYPDTQPAQLRSQFLECPEGQEPGLVEGLVALSGVFTETLGAWTVPVTIDYRGAPAMDNPNAAGTFKQGMNNYHSVKAAFYSESTGMGYASLFGGITLLFYDRDLEDFIYYGPENPLYLPWTNQITTVAMDPEGGYVQYLMNNEFPEVLMDGKALRFGAEAELIRSPDVPVYANGVVKLDEVFAAAQAERTLGWIFGGIATNGAAVGIDGVVTNASNLIFRVKLVNNN